jgi:hypothetical protein
MSYRTADTARGLGRPLVERFERTAEPGPFARIGQDAASGVDLSPTARLEGSRDRGRSPWNCLVDSSLEPVVHY